MYRHIRRGAAGFSMVELLVTMVIAAIAFAALVPLFVTAQQRGAGAQYRSAAINLAQDRIERLRELPWSVLVTDPATPATNLATLGDHGGGLFWGDVTVGSKTYTVNLLSVQTVGSTQKTVSVRVTWYEQPGHVQRTLVLTTSVFRQLPGPQVIDLSFSPPPDTSSPSNGNWITSVPGGLISITATINPAQVLDCKRVRFTVVDMSGKLAPVVQYVSTHNSTATNQFTYTQWGSGVTLHDGLYRVAAVAYSQDTNGQTSLPGNTYPRDIRIETAWPAAAVFSVYAGNVTPAVVNLLFTPSTAPDWDYFQVWRSTSAGGDYTLVADAVRSYGYMDLGVTDGTTYYYKVRAVDTAGTFLPLTDLTAKSATPALNGAGAAPKQPTALTVSFTGASVKLDWSLPTSLTDIVGYHVYRDADSVHTAGVSLVASASSVTGVVSYTAYDAGIEWLTPYYYTVRSFTADGVESPAADTASTQATDAGWATVTTPAKPMYDLRMSVFGLTGNKTATVTVTDAATGTLVTSAGYTATATNGSASRQLPIGNYIVTAISNNVTKSTSVALTGDPAQPVWVALSF